MDVVSVLERVVGVDLAHAERDMVCAMFTDLARVSAWIEAQRVAGFVRLGELTDVVFPDAAVTAATRERAAEAQRLARRAQTLTLFPRFAKALEAGEVTAAHVDAVTNGLADVPNDKRHRFVVEQDPMLDSARRVSADRFARIVRDTVKRVLSTEDESERLRRQQRATTLASWINTATGMLHLRGRFNPETGAELLARLDSARQQLFPNPKQLHDTCPTDPGERDDHLRALTLARLLLDPDHAPGWRPETLLVTDEDTRDHGYHSRSIVDAGIEADLPHEAVQRLAARGRIVRVVMRHGVVTSVDGRTNLDRGRTARLADLDQRRALRAMYPCCAIPDCQVRFQNCDIHHVLPWEVDGSTDLANLLPLCSRHHHAVHDHGWTLQLDPVTRVLTVTHPDSPAGAVTTAGPPYAHVT